MPNHLAAEELFQSSEDHFRYIANYIPALVWVANADGWIYWCNNHWYEFTGTTPEQMEGWGWQSVHDPAVLPNVLEKWRSSIDSGKPFEMVFRLRGTNGVFHAFLTRINPIRDDQSKILRWVGTNADMTSQLYAEALLAQKDTLLRAPFRQTYSFMVLLNTDGTIVEANDVAPQALEADSVQVNGLKFWEPGWWASLPDEVEKLQRSVARAAQGESVSEECRYMLPDGTIRFAERSLNPLRNDRGEIIMVISSGIDVTEQQELRHKLEDRVRVRTRDLEERNHQLRELSARLLRSQDDERPRLARELHDSVGQMLAALGMNIGLVLGEMEQLTVDAQSALLQNQQILKLINQEIRTLSHLLHPSLLEELGIVPSLRSWTEGFAERSKIHVSLDVPEELALLPAGMDLAIFRIVQECLTNVYRHSGSRTALIRIKTTPGLISLQVKDDGKGMPAGAAGQPHGVGLTGIRERVREFGGSLEIQSSDSGTIVTAYFPQPESVRPSLSYDSSSRSPV